MSDDFKEGYQQGFQDGYNLGKKGWQQPTVPNPFTDIPKEGWKAKQSCIVCGMSFVDTMGRPIAMGYVCPHNHCPSKITCSMTIKDPGPADGLSYEEIYGSVIYQQNNKKEE